MFLFITNLTNEVLLSNGLRKKYFISLEHLI